MEINAALRGEQRILPGGAHAHAPTAEAQEAEQRAVSGKVGEHQHQRPQGDVPVAGQGEGRVGDTQCLRRVLLLRRPDQDDNAADQNAERDRGENGGQHHLASHLAHQKDIDQRAGNEAQDHGSAERHDGMAGKQRGAGQHQIGAEHHQFAVREIEHAADPIDQDVTAGDQGVDRGKDDDVDEELQRAGFRMALKIG